MGLINLVSPQNWLLSDNVHSRSKFSIGEMFVSSAQQGGAYLITNINIVIRL